MKVFVVGAHGQVGQLIVETLLTNDCEVMGSYRDPASQAPAASSAFTPVAFDLNQPIDKLAAAMTGADAVIFAAGSAGKSLLAIDLDGAVKTMAAAQQAGVTRFIQLSTINAELRDKWPNVLHDYYIAKFYADEWLRTRTMLDWVIVQPVALTNEAGTGKITLQPAANGTISRQDVATVLVEAVTSELHRETIKIASGTVPIAQAF